MGRDWNVFLDELHERLGVLLADTERRAVTQAEVPTLAILSGDAAVQSACADLQVRRHAQEERLKQLDEELTQAEEDAIVWQRRAQAARLKLADWASNE